jgi:16S rRNA (cytosine1402-N4)-methyltransferase
VLLAECLEGLAVRADGAYVDCTAGGGGHSAGIAALLGPKGRLVSIDRDPDAVAATQRRLEPALAARAPAERPRLDVVKSTFSRIPEVLPELGLSPGGVDGVLADLGVSSYQFDRSERGFSFSQEGPLDMRMDRSQPLRAWDLVNDLPEDVLAGILKEYGEEREARRIARAIVRRRQAQPFRKTTDLAAVVEDSVGGRRGARIHPATRTFQALRIQLNREDAELDALLPAAWAWLRAGGRLCVISFHSGEDRKAKQFMADLRKACVCPPQQPVCTCGRTPRARLPWPSGRTAGDEELARNPRARSARLRVAEKLELPDAA